MAKQHHLILLDGEVLNSEQRAEKRRLDAEVSYITINQCVQTLELNEMEELRDLKNTMRKIMKKLAEIKKNGN